MTFIIMLQPLFVFRMAEKSTLLSALASFCYSFKGRFMRNIFMAFTNLLFISKAC